MVREPVVAGQFYPSDPSTLKEVVRKFLSLAKEKYRAKAVFAPHAGYIYSGKVAGIAIGSVEIPDSVVILSPNHTGSGKCFAVWDGDAFATPLGNAEIDRDLADRLVKEIPEFEYDNAAHIYEHSIEVLLPFILEANENCRIVPVVVRNLNLEALKIVGKRLGEVLKELSPSTLIVVSTDLNHYEPHEVTVRKDEMAISEILKLSSDGLWKTVMENDISMCGLGASVMAIEASKVLGASKGVLLAHSTSADAFGEKTATVGYAAVVLL